ncbi:MAG: winged helix-turn-helix domain-containing protein [Candidatus Muirbacterium halophilum]|nr:winged helix-turn-helix domain-containing protein [Candidatus Muirbacterium halophilum]MCK9474819.1 winged helix-turn-helix domain-containing protein [Candidatus Muirbacterium halophilum]
MFYKDEDLKFLKPSPEMRELMILSQFEKKTSISQSTIAKYLGISVAMINKYISRFADEEIILIEGDTNRNTEYLLTVKGYERLRFLLNSYMIETVRLYKDAKKEFVHKFESLIKRNISKVIFYGAGETAEIAMTVALEIGLRVVAVIDQEKNKQGKTVNGVLVVSPAMLNSIDFEAIIISSYGFVDEIYEKVKKYERENKIIIKL